MDIRGGVTSKQNKKKKQTSGQYDYEYFVRAGH